MLGQRELSQLSCIYLSIAIGNAEITINKGAIEEGDYSLCFFVSKHAVRAIEII